MRRASLSSCSLLSACLSNHCSVMVLAELCRRGQSNSAEEASDPIEMWDLHSPSWRLKSPLVKVDGMGKVPEQ